MDVQEDVLREPVHRHLRADATLQHPFGYDGVEQAIVQTIDPGTMGER